MAPMISDTAPGSAAGSGGPAGVGSWGLLMPRPPEADDLPFRFANSPRLRSKIRNCLAVVAPDQEPVDFDRDRRGDRLHAAVRHDELANAGMVAAEDPFPFPAHEVGGTVRQAKTGTAHAGEVTVPVAVVH